MLAQTSRIAVYGPVRTVVWQGSAGDRRPYANLTGNPELNGTHFEFLVCRLSTRNQAPPGFRAMFFAT